MSAEPNPLDNAFAPTQPLTALEHTAPTPSGPLPFSFTGSGSEYFRIWIVNLLLTIVTLGIYSAWAKVRRLQYVYRNTQLNGSPFDYHGSPIAILKGRGIIVGVIALASLLELVNPFLKVVVFILLGFATPYLVVRSLKFRLRNTSYRSLRFKFSGQTRDAFTLFLGWPILVAFTLYLTFPIWQRKQKEFQVNNSQYGQIGFAFNATNGDFYGVYLKMLFLSLLTAGLAGAIASFSFSILHSAVIGVLAISAAYFFLLLVMRPFYLARMQNLVWNNTQLGPHQFSSAARVKPLVGIVLVNTLLTILTLGLYYPFAYMRMLKYRVSAVSLQPMGSLETFIGEQQADSSALGEEAADWFDFDISL